LYNTPSTSALSYGIETWMSADLYAYNNIFQKIATPLLVGNTSGSVFFGNFCINDLNNSTTYMYACAWEHDAGTSFNLFEGNDGAAHYQDDIHGSHFMETDFRNRWVGWETTKSVDTMPELLFSHSRYANIIGNVEGTASYHTNYQFLFPTTATSACSTTIDVFGYAWTFGSSPYCGNDPNNNVPSDPLVATSAMRWGNCDVVSSPNCRFVSSEVPNGFSDGSGSPSLYINSVPATSTLPNSFFLNGLTTTTSASPCGSGLSFNKNPTRGTCEPFPWAGPDVTGGDLGTCNSGTYLGSQVRVGSSQCGGGVTITQLPGGHANLNPAMSCYLDIMGGPPDGTGSMLTFSPSSCYASDTGAPPLPVSPVLTFTVF